MQNNIIPKVWPIRNQEFRSLWYLILSKCYYKYKNVSPSFKSILIYRNGAQSCRKERREESRQGEGQRWWKEKEKGKEKGKLCYLQCTSTRCWSKFTLILVSPAKPWASWNCSSTTSSSASPLKLPALPTTTRNQPSAPARSRPPSGCFCPVNLPSTPWVKEPTLWPSTLAASKLAVWVSRQNKRLL